MANGVVLPIDGAVPPPPVPDIAGLQQMVGAAPPPSPGEAVANDIVARLRPVYRMVGELVDYLLANPDIAPAARSIIQMSFGATRGMRPARQRGQEAPPERPVVPGVGMPGMMIPPPPPPAPIPGLPMAPNLGRSPFG